MATSGMAHKDIWFAIDIFSFPSEIFLLKKRNTAIH